ncbi:hypothetical protein D9611_003233 [Ephemerocybe angulata]|uniref:Uncharacterized protein n=1 Tax=Ephemerocybe angulata TaxID=980116 RepID=A0A8H5C8I7_9AGAR|nr:hypothetical protein D9611_003233 [Tulosesus angulatus]
MSRLSPLSSTLHHSTDLPNGNFSKPRIQHYIWAGGHFLLLASALRIFLSWVTFGSPSSWWYKASFSGALLSYAIVCIHLNSILPTRNDAWLTRWVPKMWSMPEVLKSLQNVQYFALAIFWWTSKPVTIALVPYAIFSLFHALTFARTTLMPQLLPPGPPATAGGPPTPPPLAKRLQVWVKANYDRAMSVVAYAEILIFVRVLLGAITFQNSLLSPLIVAHFLRQRYHQSAFTRHAVANVDAQLSQLARRPGIPPVVDQVWQRARGLISGWAGSVLQAPPAAPAGAGAGAARR